MFIIIAHQLDIFLWERDSWPKGGIVQKDLCSLYLCLRISFCHPGGSPRIRWHHKFCLDKWSNSHLIYYAWPHLRACKIWNLDFKPLIIFLLCLERISIFLKKLINFIEINFNFTYVLRSAIFYWDFCSGNSCSKL